MKRRFVACVLLPLAMSPAHFAAAAPAVPPAAPAAPPAPPAAPGGQAWLPRGAATLIALDKIDARSMPLQVPVGQTVHYGSLAITVQRCEVRPPDAAPDAAAWVDILDSHPSAPGFHGWMLLDEPNLSSFEHPVYDIRLAGCR